MKHKCLDVCSYNSLNTSILWL